MVLDMLTSLYNFYNDQDVCKPRIYLVGSFVAVQREKEPVKQKNTLC
jgi:hypothetical protein